MASDSPFPVTAQNINPKVCAASNSPFMAFPLVVFRFFTSGCAKVASFELCDRFFYLGMRYIELMIVRFALEFSVLVCACCVTCFFVEGSTFE